MSKKKLTGGLALAALAAGGCGDSPQEQFEGSGCASDHAAILGTA